MVALADHKDNKKYLDYLKDFAEHIYLPESEHFKLLSSSKVAGDLSDMGFSEYSFGEDVEETFNTAIKKTATHDQILIVCGSFYLMGGAREHLGLEEKGDEILTKKALAILNKAFL